MTGRKRRFVQTGADPARRHLDLWRRKRELGAWDALLRAERGRACAIARRLLDSSDDAEDAVQDAFLRLTKQAIGFRDLRAFRNATYRAVRQSAYNIARSNRRLQSCMKRLRSDVGPARGVVHNGTAEIKFDGEARELLKVHINRMRQKMRAVAEGGERYIKTVRGFGYRLSPPEE